MEYQNKWQPYQLNIEFWQEVLVGRKIVKLGFNALGIVHFVLDSGETVYLRDNTLMIKVQNPEIENGC